MNVMCALMDMMRGFSGASHITVHTAHMVAYETNTHIGCGITITIML